MKRILLTALFIIPFGAKLTAIQSEGQRHPLLEKIVKARSSSVDKIIEFNTMEKGHMDDWFNFAKELHEAKYDLLKKHHDERINLHNKELGLLKREILGRRTLDHKLNLMIDLHEKQNGDWKKWHEKTSKNAMNLARKHHAELERFKRSLR